MDQKIKKLMQNVVKTILVFTLIGTAIAQDAREIATAKPTAEKSYADKKSSKAMPFITKMRIPFIPIIEAQVNGKTQRFLVDTGAQSNLMTPEFVKSLGVKLYSKKGSFGGVVIKKNTILQKGTIDKIELSNGVALKSVPFTQYDISHINRLLNPPLAGIIGMKVLKHHMCQFDFPNKKFILDGKTEGVPVKAVWYDNRIYTGVMTDGAKVPFIVDTAASVTMVDAKIWAIISKDKKVREEDRKMLGATAAKINQRQEVMVKSFVIGNLIELKNIKIVRGTRNILGMNVLKKFIITMDRANKTMYLKNDKIKQPK